MTTTDATPRRQRADARRNAERILTSAHRVFERHGPDASLEEIAREAGVGIGTLYRHFPTRDALVEAVFQEKIETQRRRAAELLEADEPRDAFATWLGELLVQARDCQGLGAEAMIKMLDDGAPKPCEAMRATGAQLLARAQDAGEIVPNADIDDLLRLVNAVALSVGSGPDATAQGARMLGVIVDGISTRA